MSLTFVPTLTLIGVFAMPLVLRPFPVDVAVVRLVMFAVAAAIAVGVVGECRDLARRLQRRHAWEVLSYAAVVVTYVAAMVGVLVLALYAGQVAAAFNVDHAVVRYTAFGWTVVFLAGTFVEYRALSGVRLLRALEDVDEGWSQEWGAADGRVLELLADAGIETDDVPEGVQELARRYETLTLHHAITKAADRCGTTVHAGLAGAPVSPGRQTTP